eukprot:3152932-Rhodomonas_salina.1
MRLRGGPGGDSEVGRRYSGDTAEIAWLSPNREQRNRKSRGSAKRGHAAVQREVTWNAKPGTNRGHVARNAVRSRGMERGVTWRGPAGERGRRALPPSSPPTPAPARTSDARYQYRITCRSSSSTRIPVSVLCHTMC